MKNCKVCGTEIEDDVKVCPECGNSAEEVVEATPVKVKNQPNPMALTGFIIGIVSFIISYFKYLGTTLSVAALTFSIIGIITAKKNKSPKALAVVGLVFGAVAFVYSIIWMIYGDVIISAFQKLYE